MNKDLDLLPYSVKKDIPLKEIIEIDSYLSEFCKDNKEAFLCNRSYEIIPKTRKDRKKSKSLFKEKKLIGQGTYGRIYSVSSFPIDAIIKASVPDVDQEFIALHEIFVNVVLINKFLTFFPKYTPNFVPTFGFFACAQLDQNFSRSAFIKIVKKNGTEYTVKPKTFKSVIPRKGGKIMIKDIRYKITSVNSKTKEFTFNSQENFEIGDFVKYIKIIPTKILDFCIEKGDLNFNLIQKNMNGYKNLYSFLKDLSLLEFKQIVKKLMKILIALNEYCDFRHNDLHPGNIMIRKTEKDFDVVLIDFGFASFNYKGFFYYNIIDLNGERYFEKKIKREFKKSCIYDLLFLMEYSSGYNLKIDNFLYETRLSLLKPLLPLSPPNFKIYDYLLSVELVDKQIEYINSITYKWFLDHV